MTSTAPANAPNAPNVPNATAGKRDRASRRGGPVHGLLLALAALLLLLVQPQAGQAAGLETAAEEAILIDDSTGTVLLEKNADRPMPPSSMAKLMTAYIVFDRLKKGEIALDDTFSVSEKAWRTGGSKMFVLVNDEVRVEDLLQGVIVQSATMPPSSLQKISPVRRSVLPN